MGLDEWWEGHTYPKWTRSWPTLKSRIIRWIFEIKVGQPWNRPIQSGMMAQRIMKKETSTWKFLLHMSNAKSQGVDSYPTGFPQVSTAESACIWGSPRTWFPFIWFPHMQSNSFADFKFRLLIINFFITFVKFKYKILINDQIKRTLMC